MSIEEINSIPNVTWDSEDKMVYKGVRLLIPRYSLIDSDMSVVDFYGHLKAHYKIAVPYHRDKQLKKLGI
jgi:hypothetical protein